MNDKRIVAVLVLAASVACATDYTWNQTGGTGTFQTDSCWTPAGVPGATDRVFFTSGGICGVSFADSVLNANATVGAGIDVTFDLGGHTWQVTNANPFAFSGTGTARFGGGTLELSQTNSAAYNGPNPAPGPNQKMVLNDGTTIFRGCIGTAVGGTIEVNGGSHALLSGLSLNTAPAGGVSFRMTNGTVNVDNISYTDARTVLATGSAKMSLEGGAFVAKKTMDVYGGSVINVYTNASLNTLITFNFARDGGYQSSLNIYGGTVSNVGGINVGMTIGGQQPKASTGLVYLADGLLQSGSITLGTQSNSVGILRQSGGVFRMTGTLSLGAAQRTLGVYTQAGGTAWCNAVFAGTGAGAVGEVVLTGGALATPNAFAIGNGNASVGRVTLAGGELVISNNLNLGCVSGASGNYSNADGRAWCNQICVGLAAGATGAVFLAGGTLTASGVGGASYIGGVAGASARMFQSGGALTVSTNFIVGNTVGASGTFTNVGGSVRVSGSLFVGNASGAFGRVSFAGTSLVADGGIAVGNFAGSTGELVLAGGLLPMTNANLVVGNSAGSVGRMELAGGTNLINNLQVGAFGSALVRVTGGYTYTTNRTIVGCFASSTGRLELCGGVLATPIIDGRDPTAATLPGGLSEVLFDGGTLQHSIDGDVWMTGSFVSTFAKATLTARGAVIDTAGGTLMIPQALSNEVGQAGSFTKKGLGKLTLSSPNNGFTGRVAAEQGELAVSGSIYLTGGVAASPGALLNLSAATVLDALTASGTVSRIDGALILKSGGVLTNGVGASLGGSGVITGKVVFASGSLLSHAKTGDAGPLRVTEGAVVQTGTTVSLAGYTVQDLESGVPLMSTVSAGGIQLPGRMIPVTLDGASYNTWWANLSDGGKTLTARVIPFGTLIKLL
jgi:fibronectin-binding autotransporter adhesin